VTTIQLEWDKLSQLTGDPKWSNYVRRAMLAVKQSEPSDGLYPMFIHPDTGRVLFPARSLQSLGRKSVYGCDDDAGRFTGGVVTLGARGDSLYEVMTALVDVSCAYDRVNVLCPLWVLGVSVLVQTVHTGRWAVGSRPRQALHW
jgi:hypothetical protein